MSPVSTPVASSGRVADAGGVGALAGAISDLLPASAQSKDRITISKEDLKAFHAARGFGQHTVIFGRGLHGLDFVRRLRQSVLLVLDPG